MKIQSKDPRFKVTTEPFVFEINYGETPAGTDMTVNINLEDVYHLETKVSCGCTKPEVTIIDDKKFEFKVIYNNQKKGVINQYIEELMLDAITNKKFQIRINLTGTVL